ncbi:hypothetical protein PsYK624_084570 [Phanerochaete sordida]|uniref:Uncharacterized protein n=1 Tax=Phanerochaete sordida TaxID=48140 RepID=A0A9P3GCE0_9APHY|nr:hypothetical protein PsYK624_084570 [Phanerochaete sordida]
MVNVPGLFSAWPLLGCSKSITRSQRGASHRTVLRWLRPSEPPEDLNQQICIRIITTMCNAAGGPAWSLRRYIKRGDTNPDTHCGVRDDAEAGGPVR